jgi:hypothetical protein
MRRYDWLGEGSTKGASRQFKRGARGDQRGAVDKVWFRELTLNGPIGAIERRYCAANGPGQGERNAAEIEVPLVKS